MSKELELHPLCSLFPRLEGDEFEKLKEDIRVHGQRAGIILYEGKILDGGNRYRACLELGIEPWTIEGEFSDESPLDFVLSLNLRRRHLTPGQQAMIVAAGQDWDKAKTVGRPENGQAVDHFSTVKDRAAKAGVSRVTQMKADAVHKADPELAKKVISREVSLPKAVRQIEERNAETAAEVAERTGPVARKPSAAIAEAALQDALAERDEARENETNLADALAEAKAELDAYRAGEMGDGEKQLAAANKRIFALEAELRRVEDRRDSLMNENAQLKSEVKRLRKGLGLKANG